MPVIRLNEKEKEVLSSALRKLKLEAEEFIEVENKINDKDTYIMIQYYKDKIEIIDKILSKL